MHVEDLRKYCLSFPDATENVQWKDDLCFKVAGRIFAIIGLSAVPTSLCFKCDPDVFGELIEREEIRPAPYVGRYKWVMLDRSDALNNHELQEFIRQSYEMVAAKAPKLRLHKSASQKSKTSTVRQRSTHARARSSRRSRDA